MILKLLLRANQVLEAGEDSASEQLVALVHVKPPFENNNSNSTRDNNGSCTSNGKSNDNGKTVHRNSNSSDNDNGMP